MTDFEVSVLLVLMWLHGLYVGWLFFGNKNRGAA